MKPIGRIFKNEIKPKLNDISNPKKIKSVLVGSALLKTMGDIISKDKKGGSIKLAGGALFPETVNLFKKNIRKISKSIKGGNITHDQIKKEVSITAKDLLGHDWKNIGKRINQHLNELISAKSGGSLLKKLELDHFGTRWKNSMMKAKMKLNQFWQGKTAIKPSHVVGLTAIALGATAALATAQPELVPLSTTAVSALGLTSKMAGFTSSGLALFGKGLNIPDAAKKFIMKHSSIARLIMDHINENKDTAEGSGLSKRTKNILKLAGAAGIIGASAFLNWYSNASNNGHNPIQLHDLELSINEDIPNVMEHSYEQIPNYISLQGSGSISAQKGDAIGMGFGSDIINFIKKHKKKALAIVLGTAALGAALYAGEMAFRDKFNGTALTSKEGLSLLNHILSGSDKKWEGELIRMNGQTIIRSTGIPGMGMNPKIAKLLALAGVSAVPAAIALASYALGLSDISSMNGDDFGDVSAEQHFAEFGEGLKVGMKVPRRIKRLIQDNKYIANKIFKTAQTMMKKGGRTQCDSFPCPELKNGKYGKLPGSKRPRGRPSGSISLAGQGEQKRIGSKREVWVGTAMKTSGGLTRADLMKNKRGKVVSIKQHKKGLSVAHNLVPIKKA